MKKKKKKVRGPHNAATLLAHHCRLHSPACTVWQRSAEKSYWIKGMENYSTSKNLMKAHEVETSVFEISVNMPAGWRLAAKSTRGNISDPVAANPKTRVWGFALCCLAVFFLFLFFSNKKWPPLRRLSEVLDVLVCVIHVWGHYPVQHDLIQ